MTDFLAPEERALLERNGLGTFDQLWAVQLAAVDEPNTSRGGSSSVFRLDVEGQGFYLKRQTNYLTRTLHRPFGEPSFAREFRNIRRYQLLGIPALQAVLKACGQLARQLHSLRQVHGCFYPKHIFLRSHGDGYQAQLIDLEKTRPLLFGQRDRVKDLEPLLRRASVWSVDDVRALLAAYLDQSPDSSLVQAWLARLSARSSHKESR
ncbi:lipopolysaccharide kinase InaA family protein [Pseudomonas saponiphila]|uniref:lipopolysaccharide kinase InaA family protein n=1 Tax=Pseudomonas saponiphila TaxID=556534 RepID=UPI002240B50E|nr:lipopolysaccharide kinase InaA family protein [Pseudomonas saponiphila]